MSGPHLGARVSPLVDGRLAPDAALRAGEHVRACCECAEAVEAERLVRARLRALPEPELSGDLLVRLLDIGGPAGPLPPRDRPMAVPARPAVGAAPPGRPDATRPQALRPAGRLRPPARPGRRARRRPVAAALAGTFSLLGVGIAGFLVLGGQHASGPAPVAELRTTPSSAPATPSPTASQPAPATPSAPGAVATAPAAP
ncbi:anti-sigma factor family protein [Kineococcus auxinigenes]|uniref:anti-sigma factor family protein n=1 Tax=unclassified Kineococcus TaxID=2621656 RepID=UPI003D7EBE53